MRHERVLTGRCAGRTSVIYDVCKPSMRRLQPASKRPPGRPRGLAHRGRSWMAEQRLMPASLSSPWSRNIWARKRTKCSRSRPRSYPRRSGCLAASLATSPRPWIVASTDSVDKRARAFDPVSVSLTGRPFMRQSRCGLTPGPPCGPRRCARRPRSARSRACRRRARCPGRWHNCPGSRS